MRYIPQIVIFNTIIAFLIIGIVSFVMPKEFLQLFGVIVNTPAGVSELKAQYGGLFIFLAIFEFLLLKNGQLKTALLFQTLLLAGINSGRLISLIDDGFSSFYTYTPFHQYWMIFLDPIGLISGLAGLLYLAHLNSNNEAQV